MKRQICKVDLNALILISVVSIASAQAFGGAEEKSNLKILDVQFEPIRQGKNVVRVKVQNTSEQDQTFRIQIYTRSPDYRRNGVGWGTSFFDTIKPNETKWTRLAFKIQGPITDATYIQLAFHNPGPAASFDMEKWLEKKERKKWFKRIKYGSNDLEHHQPDEKSRLKPASEGQAKAVTQAFEKIQGFITDREYKQAWGLFTKDYQDAEFQLGGLEKFKGTMEPVHPIDSVFWWERDGFLNLEPRTVFESEGVFTLEGISEGQNWAIDFVQEEGQW